VVVVQDLSRPSIGDVSVILVARGPAFEHEPLEVGEGLGDREAALRRRELGAEQSERDVERRGRVSAASVSARR
jgi:hypothetical protein